MYAILKDGAIDRYPLSLPALRRALPWVSFPATPAAADLALLGVVEVVAGPQPTYDVATQTVVEGAPTLEEGQWREQWAVQALPAEEVVARATARLASMTCTPRQARLALQQAGLLAAVEAWIASADEATRIEWEFALEIRRDWQPLAACASALGLTDEQLDGLFALAGAL